MVGEGCFLTAVPAPELQARTGRGPRRALHPQHGRPSVGGRSGPLGAIPGSGEMGLAGCQGLYSTKGKAPAQSRGVSEGLGFGGAPLVPPWKG